MLLEQRNELLEVLLENSSNKSTSAPHRCLSLKVHVQFNSSD